MITRKMSVQPLVIALMAAMLMGFAGSARAQACENHWGNSEKSAYGPVHTPLMNITTGRHDCFDRMTFDVRLGHIDGEVGYRVRYVNEIVQDGSGTPLPVKGGAVIEVRISVPSYDPESGEAAYAGRAGERLPGVDLRGYQTFRDARFVGSFEGDTQVGLGVRERLPFRVFEKEGIVVVDVAHIRRGP